MLRRPESTAPLPSAEREEPTEILQGAGEGGGEGGRTAVSLRCLIGSDKAVYPKGAHLPASPFRSSSVRKLLSALAFASALASSPASCLPRAG